MNEAFILNHLEELASRLGVELRYENLTQSGFRMDGGYCRLAGKPIILVNKRVPSEQKIRIIAVALNRFDLQGIFVPPGIRELIESHQKLSST
jgi:hypothetical protein